ncbi:hypothetical protein JAAARDRAFT_631840 [Jaapia argillacea MUCL 33604]|uniref:Uncharacterized protein n=1 Tax=Jaapia argillacea MUCL 33604 TaxID=933084 RepID=A0A067Q8D3_9AGAM|nr:hypothetical protein JAAARDRAFT_631840 [Jaapia argillacea MUCL 33604]
MRNSSRLFSYTIQVGRRQLLTYYSPGVPATSEKPYHIVFFEPCPTENLRLIPSMVKSNRTSSLPIHPTADRGHSSDYGIIRASDSTSKY